MFINALKKAAKELGISPAELLRRTSERQAIDFYRDYTPEEKKKHKEEVDLSRKRRKHKEELELSRKRRKSMDEYYKRYGSSEALYSSRPCILSKRDRRS